MTYDNTYNYDGKKHVRDDGVDYKQRIMDHIQGDLNSLMRLPEFRSPNTMEQMIDLSAEIADRYHTLIPDNKVEVYNDGEGTLTMILNPGLPEFKKCIRLDFVSFNLEQIEEVS